MVLLIKICPLNAVFEESDNFKKNCGSTPHGGTETRKRYLKGVGQGLFRCELMLETQTRTCHHGALTDWTGKATHTSCRNQKRHTKKMDCKQNCPSGWNHFSTTNHGCCAHALSCFGNMKWCEKYDYEQRQVLEENCAGYQFYEDLPEDWCTRIDQWAICGIANGKVSGKGYNCEFTPGATGNCKDLNSGNTCNALQKNGRESFATAQSVISIPAEFSMLNGFALLGLIFIMYSSYKKCSKQSGYVDVPEGAEPQEI